MNPRGFIGGLFLGQVALLDQDSRSSAIVKSAVRGPCLLTPEGLAGDSQADRRVHGGTEKAVHLYPAEHYAHLAAAFPAARHLVPGGLGENLSTTGLTEDLVCIGDRYAIGTAVIEVSQPRSPCWKIDHRVGVEGMAALIARAGLTGWYFRVIDQGRIGVGDRLDLSHRPAGAVSLAEYLQVSGAHRPSLETVLRVAAAPGLSPDKRQRLEDRAAWLRAHGEHGKSGNGGAA